MSFDIKSAIECLESQIKDGEFNALTIIKYLNHESDIWVNHVDQIWVDKNLINDYKSPYDFKRELWEIMKNNFQFDGDCFLPQFLKSVSFDELKEFTSKHNLFSALLEYTKEKVRKLLWDIDNDVLESVLKRIKKEMENENEQQ